MALTEQFKRCVVAVFQRKNLRVRTDLEKAVAAVEICRSQLTKARYLSYDSVKRRPELMKPTTKGKRASRDKRGDSSHARKMREFIRIWELYKEAEAKGMTDG